MDGDVKHLVRGGYDRAADSYLAARPQAGDDVAVLARLIRLVPRGGRVLDAGCGAGLPVSAELVRHGVSVTGLDLSRRQLQLARAHTALSALAQADLAALPFATGVFDAVVSYYAIFHLPRAQHAAVFADIHRVLRPGGHALLCLGSRDKPDDRDPHSWLGEPMYWSQFDAATNLELMAGAGFRVAWHGEVTDPMGHGGHLFVLGERLGTCADRT